MSEKPDLNEIEIRSLATPDDYDQCVGLQRDIWGNEFRITKVLATNSASSCSLFPVILGMIPMNGIQTET